MPVVWLASLAAEERPRTIASGTKLMEEAAYATMAKTGTEVPAVVCETLDGRKLDLRAQRGKVLVIYFFDLDEHHSVVALKNEVQGFVAPFVRDWANIEILAVGRGASNEELQALSKRLGIEVALVPDPESRVSLKFASRFVPRFFVIGKDGKVAFERTGVHEVKGVKGLREALMEQLVAKVKP